MEEFITENSQVEGAVPAAVSLDPVDTSEAPIHAELERFDGLPNRREALRAKDSENKTIFLSHSIARKIYSCHYCPQPIPLGSEHVVISRIQMKKGDMRYRTDFSCLKEKVLPELSDIKVIKPSEAQLTEINRRARRYRDKHRNPRKSG